MTTKFHSTAKVMLAVSLALGLSACGGMPNNRSLESVHQPVVERDNYVFDVSTLPGGGLSVTEQRRLADWFDVMDLRYGDRIAIDDPASSSTTHSAIEGVAARWGMLITDGAPITEGDVVPGNARIVVTRTIATVPGCPDWGDKTHTNPNNATSRGYGCAVNGNMAAMIANPEDLVRGQRGKGETVIMSASKAIDTYRAQDPTGKGGLKEVSSK